MTQLELWQGPIIDAHQHFWDPQRNPHPWLKPGANIPFRYGDYSAIKRRYLPDDYFVDTARHDVRQTVYVETEWDENDPIGETAYAAGLAKEFDVPTHAGREEKLPLITETGTERNRLLLRPALTVHP